MAGYSLAAVAAFAGKVYGYLKGIYDFLGEEDNLADLIEQAKNEVLGKIVEVDHLEVKDHVGAYINTFKTLPFLPPAHQDLGGFIQKGSFIIERLETYLIEKKQDVGESEAYQYQHEGKYAYYDAAPYNLVVLIQAAAMKMAAAKPEPVCALYRRAFAVNLELIGEPTTQPLPFTPHDGYRSPAGVRCFLMSRLWHHLYANSGETWKSGSSTIVCDPCASRIITTHSHIPSIYTKSVSGGSFGLEGPASTSDQKKCLDLFSTKFQQDPVVVHVTDANKHLLDLLATCKIGVHDLATALDKTSPVSIRNDMYGAEQTDWPLREMCEIIVSRIPAQ